MVGGPQVAEPLLDINAEQGDMNFDCPDIGLVVAMVPTDNAHLGGRCMYAAPV